MLGKKTFICPYCFDEHEISAVQFRCTNKRCGDFDDIEMTKYEHGDITIPKKGKKCFSFTPRKLGGIPKTAKCPECSQTSDKIVCPSCHNAIPLSTLRGRNMIISIVGTRDSGKSHFVGVIINELRERVASAFGGALEGFDDSMGRYKDVFGRHLYVDMQKLELTKKSEEGINNGAYRPYIFIMSFKHKFLFLRKIENFTLVFFDTAGEDLNESDTMNTFNKYICKSVGIIFLVDPTKIPAVAMQIPDAVYSEAATVDWRTCTPSDDILARVSKLIRKDRSAGIGTSGHTSPTGTINIPVAAVFSKFDVIEEIVKTENSSSVLLDPSPHCSGRAFDVADWYNVNEDIKGLLTTWGESAFIKSLEVNYKLYSFFAISALGLGNNPEKDSSGVARIKHPTPHRIEDPLLWILKENSVIKGKHSGFDIKELFLSSKRKARIVNTFINLKIAALVLLCSLAVWLTFSIVSNNFAMHDVVAVQFVELKGVSPSVGLIGDTKISAEILVTSRDIGNIKHDIRYVLEKVDENGNKQVIADITKKETIKYKNGKKEALAIGSYKFEPLSDYILTIYIDDNILGKSGLHGK